MRAPPTHAPCSSIDACNASFANACPPLFHATAAPTDACPCPVMHAVVAPLTAVHHPQVFNRMQCLLDEVRGFVDGRHSSVVSLAAQVQEAISRAGLQLISLAALSVNLPDEITTQIQQANEEQIIAQTEQATNHAKAQKHIAEKYAEIRKKKADREEETKDAENQVLHMPPYCHIQQQQPPPWYRNPVFPVLPRTVARTVGSQNHTTEIGYFWAPICLFFLPSPMLLTRLCLVMYATPRMLKLLLFCLWASWIVVPFNRSILSVLKIGLFVNCVSAKPGQTFFLGQRPVGLLLQPVLLLVLLQQQVQPLLLPRVLYQ